jgi:hypothetical protein
MAGKAFKEAIPIIMHRLGCTKADAIKKLRRYQDHMSIAKAVSAILDGAAPPPPPKRVLRGSTAVARAGPHGAPVTGRLHISGRATKETPQ